jgi:hypothetical protein
MLRITVPTASCSCSLLSKRAAQTMYRPRTQTRLPWKLDWTCQTLPSQSDVLAMIQFLQNGNIIRFQSGEVVECNGAALSFEANLFYVGRTPRTPPGGKFNCTYTRSGGSHALSVSVPPRPVITSPVAGSTVMRSSNLTITYAAGGGTSADAGGSHPNGSMSRNQPQPDNGSYTGFDASGFAPGLGTISLTRIAEGAAVGTPFQAARFTYRTSAQIPVTWQ